MQGSVRNSADVNKPKTPNLRKISQFLFGILIGREWPSKKQWRGKWQNKNQRDIDNEEIMKVRHNSRGK